MISISVNMIRFIGTQNKQYNIQEEKIIKEINKRRKKWVIILFILLPIVMFLLFFGDYLLNR